MFIFLKQIPQWLHMYAMYSCTFCSQGIHGTGKTGKMAKKKILSGKTQGIWKFCQNTGNFVCSSCKFPDSKGKGYCDICCNTFFSVSFVYIIVTNYVNWHRENLRLDREKTGNFKIQFEWVPCVLHQLLPLHVVLVNF